MRAGDEKGDEEKKVIKLRKRAVCVRRGPLVAHRLVCPSGSGLGTVRVEAMAHLWYSSDVSNLRCTGPRKIDPCAHISWLTPGLCP